MASESARKMCHSGFHVCCVSVRNPECGHQFSSIGLLGLVRMHLQGSLHRANNTIPAAADPKEEVWEESGCQLVRQPLASNVCRICQPGNS
jgi:hypothetical protein